MRLYVSSTALLFGSLLIALPSLTLQFDINEESDAQKEEAVFSTVDDSESLLSNVVSDVNKTWTSFYNQVTFGNISLETDDETRPVKETRRLIRCKEIKYNPKTLEPKVEIVNGSSLAKLLHVKPNVVSRDTKAACVLVLFYARACPFSAHAAPHFNALARAFPNIKMVALDALKYHGINAQYGIVGVPTLKMFHNGRPVGKFNATEYNIHLFGRFVYAITGQHALGLIVTSQDFQGPVSSVVEKETDYFLILSWIFIIACSIYYFMESKWWKMIVEMVQNNWRESEAQHEHNE